MVNEKILINSLRKSFLKENINSFLSIGSQIPKDYWDAGNYLIDLPEKWNFSRFITKNKKILGFMIATKKLNSFYINRIVVHSNYRGQSLGLELLNDAIVQGKRNCLDSIELKVHYLNIEAINWYKNKLFITSSRDGDYFKMKLRL